MTSHILSITFEEVTGMPSSQPPAVSINTNAAFGIAPECSDDDDRRDTIPDIMVFDSLDETDDPDIRTH